MEVLHFLDIQKKLLIVGDTVQLGPIYMFGEHRNLDLYIHSLEKLNTYQIKLKQFCLVIIVIH